MRAIARGTIVILAVCGTAAAVAAVAGAHGPKHRPPTQLPLHAVLNGVMDTNKKSKLGRFNFRFHVSHYGVVRGHGDYNGGSGNYISLTSITTFHCSANHLTVTGVGVVNRASVPVTITAIDGGPGDGSSSDHFSIVFGKYAKAGSPIVGKVFIGNCT